MAETEEVKQEETTVEETPAAPAEPDSDQQFTEDVQAEEMPPTGGDIEQKPAVEPEEEQPESDDDLNEEIEYECPAEFNEREEMRKMFVGGISKETSDEDFKGLFEQYGEITDFVIIRKDNKKSDRLFGFITFKNCDDLEEALLARPHKYQDRELDIKRAVPRDQDDRTGHFKVKKLHVGNVPKGMKSKELKRYLLGRHCPKYGIIEEINLLKDNDNENRGFGFITVSTEDMADRMAIGENKFTLNGTQMRISKAKPKNNEGGGGGRRNFGGGRQHHQQQQQGGWGNDWGQYGGYGGYGGYPPYGAYGGYGGGYGPQYGGYDYSYGQQQYGGNYGPDRSKRGGRPGPY